MRDFLNGISSTCPSFIDTLLSVSNDTSYSLSVQISSSGQGSSQGAVSEVAYYVSGVQRNKSILSMGKADYYNSNEAALLSNKDNEAGYAAKAITYIVGKSPDQKVIK